MQYGHFDADAREYVIDRPDTPRPWTNYLGSREYGGIVTNHGGGYSFYRSAAEGRLLRFRYNSVPFDQPGRCFYLRDRVSGDYWSAAWQPVGKPLDEYESTCRFGAGYAIINSRYGGIATETRYFVPLGEQFEYWHLRVTNEGDSPRQLSVFSFAEFTTDWQMMNDLLNLQYTQYIGRAEMLGDHLISASSCANLPDDPENYLTPARSRWWWMAQVGASVAAHDLDREAFIGVYGNFDRPQAVLAGACSNAPGCGDNLCGAMQSDIELAPGETRDLVVMLGPGKAETVGQRTIETFGTAERADAELARLRADWHATLDGFHCESPDEPFDHMVNMWNAYNAVITFNWSRACSTVYTGQERDGLGFRDSVQDVLGIVSLMPDTARERLELMLSGQDATGGAQPVVKPWLHKPGQMPPTPESQYRSDDCLWFFNAIPAYVAETGDLDFYRKVIPYADTGEDAVLGHLRRALEFNLQRTGANGLPSGLAADWNDCLQLGYHGESAFVAFQVRLGLSVYADVAERLGEPDEAAWALDQRDQLDEKIQRVCWDGEWFIWAIGEDGTVFGSRKFDEGQVYLNTQAWAVISGAATDDQREKCLAAMRDRLSSEFGLALCDPPFRDTSVDVMRAVLYNPGTKENAGIFSHPQSWGVMAEILRGDSDQAYRYYRAFMPAAYNDRADVRQIEPYVHCQSTHGPASDRFGASRLPWLTGAAAWSYFVATQWILGIQPEVDGLRIDPCIPTDWAGFTVRRRFRDMNLTIRVDNASGAGRGVSRIDIDGEVMAGVCLPIASLTDGATINVQLG